jgi:hypothetical protein
MLSAVTSCAFEEVVFLQNFKVTQILDDLFTGHKSIFICEWALTSKEVVQVLPIATCQSRAPTFRTIPAYHRARGLLVDAALISSTLTAIL